MIKVAKITEVYRFDDEEDCPEPLEVSADYVDMTFCELVRVMADGEISCHPASGSTREWVRTAGEQCYRTGHCTETTYHYDPVNHPRYAKYWKWAMQYTGDVK